MRQTVQRQFKISNILEPAKSSGKCSGGFLSAKTAKMPTLTVVF
ncbi:hypothetical protein EPIR_3323 [Erwinia piriflorinigrans CFBP 5888]|uniref:Uncharacterized protein n=1 Tax=Erwinia piriflorinigrans CFBP 5888 TaxID=1161919 RepID=V5ZCM7_9GAMM|nr:hypothetical protein EPIR_3323 [Erwinia piriflorinigrans CFBP 5888]